MGWPTMSHRRRLPRHLCIRCGKRADFATKPLSRHPTYSIVVATHVKYCEGAIWRMITPDQIVQHWRSHDVIQIAVTSNRLLTHIQHATQHQVKTSNVESTQTTPQGNVA